MKFILTLFTISITAFTSQASITLHCPPNQTLPCTAQSDNLMAYGDAYLMKHGVKYSAGLAHVENNLNSCNVGTIIRKWQAEDENWNLIECKQILTYVGGSFNITNIEWPEGEYHLLGCEEDLDPDNLPFEYAEPRYRPVQCSQVADSYQDRVFEFGSDCKKIVREWTVIDWCNYRPGGSKGIWKYSQVFKLSNADEPILSCNQKIIVPSLDCDSAYVKINDVSIEGEACVGGYIITNTSVYADTTTEDASGVYPIGVTEFFYQVEYACGKEMGCTVSVTVTEDTPPVPYCLATLNIVLMAVDTDSDGTPDDGMVEVWAKDVDHNSYHPCHNKPLNFSFSSDIDDMVKTFTCEDVGNNFVEMWVTDYLGRQSFCRVSINVQNNNANIPDCEGGIGNRTIAEGSVLDVKGQAIEDVIVSYKDLDPMLLSTEKSESFGQYVSYIRTDVAGQYYSEDVMIGRHFKVQAYKEGDVSRVDEDDLAILEAYILGQSTFKNAYTFFAADINEDHKVDIEDFHLLKNLIGQSEDKWPNEKQRIFLNKEEFDNMSQQPLNDEILQHKMIHNFGMQGFQKVDFVSILKGDLAFYEAL